MSESLNKNWVVRVYDANDDLLVAWILADRTESQAFSEAEEDVMKIPNQEDWTLTEHDGPVETAPIPLMYKAPAMDSTIKEWYEFKKSPACDNFEKKVDTYVRATPKIGRNDPCPICGSGIKYKKCCGKG